MDRIAHEGLDQAVADARAQRAPGVIDDRRDIVDRDVVCYYLDSATGEHVPSRLKPDDDVNVGGVRNETTGEVEGGMLVRVVGPGTGREYFAAVGWLMAEDEWPTMGLFHVSQVADRAPADPNEPPPHMPLILESEPTPEPEPEPGP